MAMLHIIPNPHTVVTLSSPCSRTGYSGGFDIKRPTNDSSRLVAIAIDPFGDAALIESTSWFYPEIGGIRAKEILD